MWQPLTNLDTIAENLAPAPGECEQDLSNSSAAGLHQGHTDEPRPAARPGEALGGDPRAEEGSERGVHQHGGGSEGGASSEMWNGFSSFGNRASEMRQLAAERQAVNNDGESGVCKSARDAECDRRPKVPASFDLFDKEHDEYFAQSGDGLAAEMQQKWKQFNQLATEYDGHFLCENCGEGFKKRGDYNVHRYRRHAVTVHCHQCGKTVKKTAEVPHKGDALRPRTEVSLLQRGLPRGQVSRFSITRTVLTPLRSVRSSLNSHIAAVHTNKNVRCPCPICGVHLKKASLLHHVRRHEGRLYTCEVCGKNFTSLMGRRRHRKKFCSQKYTCPHCTEGFDLAGSLEKHLSLHQGSDWCCNLCAELFTRKDEFLKHLRIHYREGNVDVKPSKSDRGETRAETRLTEQGTETYETIEHSETNDEPTVDEANLTIDGVSGNVDVYDNRLPNVDDACTTDNQADDKEVIVEPVETVINAHIPNDYAGEVVTTDNGNILEKAMQMIGDVDTSTEAAQVEEEGNKADFQENTDTECEVYFENGEYFYYDPVTGERIQVRFPCEGNETENPTTQAGTEDGDLEYAAVGEFENETGDGAGSGGGGGGGWFLRRTDDIPNGGNCSVGAGGGRYLAVSGCFSGLSLNFVPQNYACLAQMRLKRFVRYQGKWLGINLKKN
ncbi:hypothetical protein NQ317_002107 [Molorchus minor]|uniref:C2H2-type domain-containing protein n=1 Tax=Molorchus minor TaxID=1323400 RepID=A0ABQ9JUF8_9CUCU|nr:hypothetical protein NQ317_002107 [Molorchus minor]